MRLHTILALLCIAALSTPSGTEASLFGGTFDAATHAAAKVFLQAKADALAAEAHVASHLTGVIDAIAAAKTKVETQAGMIIQGLGLQHPENYLEPVRPESGHHEGIIHGSCEEVWPILADNFGNLSWWPIYLEVQDMSGHSNVGAKRKLKVPHADVSMGAHNVTTYVEELVTKDKSTWTIQYTLVSAEPELPFVDRESIITTIKLKPVENYPEHTHIEWFSKMYGVMNLTPLIARQQAKAYASGIESLRTLYGQEVGHVSVRPRAVANVVSEESFIRVMSYGKTAPEDRKVFLQISVGFYVKKTAEVPVNHHTGVADFSKIGAIKVPMNSGDKDVVFTLLSVEDDQLDFLGSTKVKLAASETEDTWVTVSESLQGVTSGSLEVDYKISFMPGEKQTFVAPSSADEFAGMVAYFAGKVTRVIRAAISPSLGPYEYEEYPVPEPMNKFLPKKMKGIVRNEIISAKKLADVGNYVIRYVYNIVNTFIMKSPFFDDQWSAYYGDAFVPPNYAINHWMDDADFARNYLAGNNPLEIQLLDHLWKLPEGFSQLKPGGESIAQLFMEKRLFFAEYPLMGWENVPLKTDLGMVHYAPFVLLYNEKVNGTTRLNVAGIKLEPKERGARVYHPGDGFPKRWLFAKMHACLADHNHHQFVRHLGWAHLFSEPLAIAAHNAFWDFPDHVIGKLLKPHYEGTIGINYFARETLVDDRYPFTGSTFSVGSDGGMTIAGLWLKDQSLLDLVHPKYMEARGFDEAKTDGVKDYWFREDGYKLWHLFEQYVTNVVNMRYKLDAEVAADPALIKYYDELSNPEKARVKGVPRRPSTKENLIQVLLAAIWPSSIIHSVVNYSQKEYTSYVPARPISMKTLMPKWAETKDLSDEFIQQALPSIYVAHFQVLFAYLLGDTPSDSYLTTMANVYDDHGEGPYEQILRDFQVNLEALSVYIQSRNVMQLYEGKAAYPYLDPQRVATSVNI